MAKEVGADSRSREPGLAARPDPTGFDRGEGLPNCPCPICIDRRALASRLAANALQSGAKGEE